MNESFFMPRRSPISSISLRAYRRYKIIQNQNKSMGNKIKNSFIFYNKYWKVRFPYSFHEVK